jgi:hypothetical protein
MSAEPARIDREAPGASARPSDAEPALDLRERWLRGWRGPMSFTALIPAKPGVPVKTLRTALTERAERIVEAFRGLPDLHAHRIVVIPEDDPYGPRLLLNSVTDASLPIHLDRLAEALAPFLADLVDLPAGASSLRELLLRHRLVEDTLFHAHPGVTVAEVHQEARLHQVLRDFVEAERAQGTLDQADLEGLRRRAHAYVERLGDPSCASGPPPAPGGAWRAWLDLILTLTLFPLLGVLAFDIWEAVRAVRGPKRYLTYVLTALWAVWAAPFSLFAILCVRLTEAIEKDHRPEPAPEAKIAHIEQFEEGRRKNELTMWFPVKPSLVGRFLMWLMLFGSERGTRHLWTRGDLAGARNIHYARLVRADGGRRMIFMSDYEGSFDAYIKHFVGVGGHTRAVIPISSRVWGCPPTRWLYFPVDTVEFRRRWREMARSYQLQASVRYVAYEGQSANDILNHRAIREGLYAEGCEPDELLAWSRRI